MSHESPSEKPKETKTENDLELQDVGGPRRNWLMGQAEAYRANVNPQGGNDVEHINAMRVIERLHNSTPISAEEFERLKRLIGNPEQIEKTSDYR